jgi:hypothetical protein
VTRLLTKIWAFLVRDFLSDASYRLAFVLQLGGMFFAVAVFFYASRMINPDDLNGVEFVAGRYRLPALLRRRSFAAKVRGRAGLGTRGDARLAGRRPPSIFRPAWDFTWGHTPWSTSQARPSFRRVKLNVTSPRRWSRVWR